MATPYTPTSHQQDSHGKKHVLHVEDNLKISIIVPFYNPPLKLFQLCLEKLSSLNAFEVIVVDDCSSNADVVAFAKQSGFTYLKTPYQSGHDGLPFNLGLNASKGDYICKIDADDMLMELPKKMETKIHLARVTRSANPTGVTVEELILAPRSIHNGAVIAKELMLQTQFQHDGAIFNDVLTLLRLLYRGETFTVHPTTNYFYNEVQGSIQTSKPRHYHRLRNIQTVARFCQLEQIPPEQSERYLQLAMLNFRYGAKSRHMLKSHNVQKG